MSKTTLANQDTMEISDLQLEESEDEKERIKKFFGISLKCNTNWM